MRLVDGIIQIFTQPVLAGLFSGLTLEAGDKATSKPQSRIKFLAGDLNLVLQLDQAVKGVAVNLDRNNSFIRCNKSVYRRNVDVRCVVDQTVVVQVCNLAECSAQAGLLRTRAVHHHLHICGEQCHIRRNNINAVVLGVLNNICQIGIAVEQFVKSDENFLAVRNAIRYAHCKTAKWPTADDA